MNIFSAAPGTYLLEREHGAKVARKIPVIGFNHIQGGVVFPLCAIAHGGLTRGRALLTPDGFVTDPSCGVVCGTVEEWMVLTGTSGYWTVVEKTTISKPQEPASSDEDDPGSDVQRQAERPATLADNALKRIPDKPAGRPQKFLNKTFWQYAGLDGHYIFMVEGGADAPAKNAAGYTKIKRDDFQAAKRAGETVIDDFRTGVVAEDEPAGGGDGSHLI